MKKFLTLVIAVLNPLRLLKMMGQKLRGLLSKR